ncbi:MAG: HEAT repeat domain-containing protein [Elusimicrobiota bacterium]|nr:HEAT repeat domain-containing protein [Elusimicrobiota bacterium]
MMNLLLALAALGAAPAAAQSTATLRGVDVYRSVVFDAAKAEAQFGGKLKEYVLLRNSKRPASDAKAEELRKAIEAEVAKKPGVAFAALRVSEYYTSVDHAMYATFDVVDEADRDRLAFAPRPTGKVPDPAGLLAAWKQYAELGAALSRQGRMPIERPDCPGFYCLWGAATPELAALQQKLVDGVPGKLKELREVLIKDADGQKRAQALYALSYANAGEQVVEDCLRALKDPDGKVRSAAVQVLADVANHHKDLRIDLDRVLPALDDPLGEVRGKVMGLLVSMSDDKEQRPKLLSAAPRLVALLKLRQPDSSDLAYTVLGLVSKKDLDRRDHPAWEKWAAAAASGKDD